MVRFLKYIWLLFSLMVVNQLSAQNIFGKLVDEQNTPIEGAYIFNINSGSHAHSNENGTFQIKESAVGDTLKIGALGYKKIVFPIGREHFGSRLDFTFKEAAVQLSEVVLRPKINALSILSEVDLMLQPVGSSQEILQKVPGLIIGQHAGGGKAEQLFLRGFDIDHGTDIALTVDNMPVNMVSHAHGQGYSDLHFVIPETLENIDFDKGPHSAAKGNFATAGYVNFKTKDQLKSNMAQFEYGDFGLNRSLGMFKLVERGDENAYIATELLRFDGPFESSQNFSRFNLFGKYTASFEDNTRFSTAISHFTSKWDASGQIPQRAVDRGIINRFGAIDDTEGGTTSRTNLNIGIHKELSENGFFSANAFWSKYDFELFSNFTFFLDDKENGDQIKQRESRNLFGLHTEFNKNLTIGATRVDLTIGAGFRNDMVRENELSRTANRKTLIESIQLGDVDETNLHGYIDSKIHLDKFLLVPGIRLDHFQFGYIDALRQDFLNQSVNQTIFSPKLSVLYNSGNDLQFFLKSGIGFHSNDTRVVVAQQGEEVLPKAYGLDLGTIFRPNREIMLNLTLWHLYLEQEFVYVGDAGIVEPSGRTERYGIDFGLRYQINDWLYFNSDATYTKARSIDDPKGNDFVPLAPVLTFTGGLTINSLKRFSGGIRYRYLGDRPANEDNSIVAEGYFVTDFNANYHLNKNLTFGVSVQNLFNTEWNETQFATLSQLRNEPQPVEEIHFTPGTPFFVRGNIIYQF